MISRATGQRTPIYQPSGPAVRRRHARRALRGLRRQPHRRAGARGRLGRRHQRRDRGNREPRPERLRARRPSVVRDRRLAEEHERGRGVLLHAASRQLCGAYRPPGPRRRDRRRGVPRVPAAAARVAAAPRGRRPLRSDDAAREAESAAADSAGAPAAAAPRRGPERPEQRALRRQEKIGTGHGERERSDVVYTQFRRATTQPNETIAIHYDTRANLLARGIIPRPLPIVDAEPVPRRAVRSGSALLIDARRRKAASTTGVPETRRARAGGAPRRRARAPAPTRSSRACAEGRDDVRSRRRVAEPDREVARPALVADAVDRAAGEPRVKPRFRPREQLDERRRVEPVSYAEVRLGARSARTCSTGRRAGSRHSNEEVDVLKPKHCPNCNEPNRPDSKFCAKCRLILSFAAYNETLEEQKKKEDKLAVIEDKFNTMQSQMQTLLSIIGSVNSREQKQEIAQRLIEKGMYSPSDSIA